VRRRGTTEPAPRRVQGDVPAISAPDTVRKALLAAGVPSSLLYIVATDVVAAAQWDNYSRTGEMVSKLLPSGRQQDLCLSSSLASAPC
jgi:hypothetical protein